MIPGGAALANAVADATGVRITTLPITPARVSAAERGRAGAPYSRTLKITVTLGLGVPIRTIDSFAPASSMRTGTSVMVFA